MKTNVFIIHTTYSEIGVVGIFTNFVGLDDSPKHFS